LVSTVQDLEPASTISGSAKDFKIVSLLRVFYPRNEIRHEFIGARPSAGGFHNQRTQFWRDCRWPAPLGHREGAPIVVDARLRPQTRWLSGNPAPRRLAG